MKLVLLPGLDGTGTIYSEFARHLAPAVSLHCFTYPFDQCLSYLELLEYVQQNLPTEEDYVVLAESFSGPLGIMLAESPPTKMRGLILCCTFAKNPSIAPKVLAPVAEMLSPKLAPRFLIEKLLMGQSRTKLLSQLLHDALKLVSGKVLAYRLGEILRVDTTAFLHKLSLPTMVMAASQDRLIHRSTTAHLSDAIPKAALVKITGPHFLLQSNPVACAESIKAWMNQALS